MQMGAEAVSSRGYSTKVFEQKYTYEGTDLGAVWTGTRTVFRIWAPTAIGVRVRLYRGGIHGTNDLIGQIKMRPDVKGTWVAEDPEDLRGVYYTYLVDRESIVKESCDPYARAVGLNGRRAMVADLSQTDPAGWEADRGCHRGISPVDAVVYELHIRDLSMDPSSGIRARGKFLGLTETGTLTPFGEKTGLDHIRAMGVTHVQLLPVYDFGSVDEAGPADQYNWGYDPLNYNVPEGSYASDPCDALVRIRELKQTVKTLHDNGLGVIMDVVYNHVYDTQRFCFNRIVPDYFSRTDRQGHYSNGSGCGNDTATERSMVRKYIVDSVVYWAREYHMDGFRFDLAGLIDTQTVNEVMAAVEKECPGLLFYGEGWTMNTQLTRQGVALTTQENAELVPGFGFFNDTFRDTMKGTVFDSDAPGYVSGALGQEEWLRDCFMGIYGWCKNPRQSVNYASCHDNMTLYDRIVLSTPYAEEEEQIRMNCLAAAITMTAQGMPLMQAGEELLRSKPDPKGGFVNDSYKSPDSVNAIKWGDLEKPACRAVRDYYKGLIAFRKAHKALRLDSAEAVRKHITCLDGLAPNVMAFHIRGPIAGESAGSIFIIFNPNREETLVALPKGTWEIHINGSAAGVTSLGTVRGRADVEPISALVLVQQKEGKTNDLQKLSK